MIVHHELRFSACSVFQDENALSILDRAPSIPGHVVQVLRPRYFNYLSRANGKGDIYSPHGNRSADRQANAKRSIGGNSGASVDSSI
jgi:hypothetical protein